MTDPQARQIWRFLIETEQLSDGTWRAWSPTRAWSRTGVSEQEAQDNAVDEAIERGEDPDELLRSGAGAPRSRIELEPDDPRVGRVWRFHPQTEQVLQSAWTSDNPGQAVRSIIEQLGEGQPPPPDSSPS
jgi:hypothetical protein